MYAQGCGVAQNYIEAHKWFSLASEAGDESAKNGLEIAESIMTAAQIAEAKELVSDWKESH
jgi:TPR repeat protein